jgi:endonuclease/exonuclease/phosphatase family metal-dependent hydrolase
MVKVALFLVVTLLTAASTPDDPRAAGAPTVATYDVWQWNVAGSTMHGGSVSDGLVDAAVSSIVGRGAEFAAFNELCRQQYEALVTRLRSIGWPQDPSAFGRFAEQQSGSPAVCAGQPMGVAVFSALPLGPAEAHTLPADGSDERRRLLCASLEDEPDVGFCTTHITTSGDRSPVNGRPHNVNQLDAVLERLEGYRAEGMTVVIAGDFNAQPNYRRLDGWYRRGLDAPANRGNDGSYRELDDDDSTHCRGYGEWTAAGTPGAAPPCAGTDTGCTAAQSDGCGKIDLIFVREDRIVGGYTGDSLAIAASCRTIPERPAVHLAGACSDHRIVTGTVTVRTGPPEGAHRAPLRWSLSSPPWGLAIATTTRSRRSVRRRRAATAVRAPGGASACR